ncbi:GNAT family N-acetyltransferase [Glycomyces salinus]|uniref:GNAT family N-acetyltransferase n=1 Tax=Glycomyces salinus TaxID=980294 RepID=UPI0018EAB8B2|nr:GNAT family N-acetyltransferase [Glycomyces salinus]
MEILRLDPADTDLASRACATLELARRTDLPEYPAVSLDRFTSFLANPPTGTEARGYVALDGGEAIGYLHLYLPMTSNSHYAEAELTVHPDHRRRGIGTALLDSLLDTARVERRTELVVLAHRTSDDGPKRSEAGAEFLERHGFALALTEIERKLELASIDPEAERRLWSQSEAESSRDYELISWTGRTPEEHLEALCRLESMIFDEIPLGDVELHRREVSPEEQRAKDDRNEASGTVPVRTIAVHRPTGEPAALTAIYTRAGEEEARQAITITAPAHRGHRLGMLAKLRNLAQLREHFGQVTTVWAGNADTNAHMVAINERLGYETVDARLCYKRELEL